MAFKEEVAESFRSLQDEICAGLEQLDGKAKFHQDNWERDRSSEHSGGGGGGRTRIIQNGDLLEKGGVNFSAVYGELPENITAALGVSDHRFFASGVSIVLHPNSPHVPIIHMNIRYFELEDGTHWFGGGIDLTPHFIIPEKAKDFHQRLKATCDRYDPSFYPKFKDWADRYFYIPHRNETRGIGGIFYDRLSESEQFTKADLLQFSLDVGRTFVPAYTAQTSERNQPITEVDRNWQLVRRGRYVEFNLVYDKGTKFGLQTAGRIESILMSLPKNASWLYNYEPQTEAEKFTQRNLVQGKDWLSLASIAE